jgi:hypothetical protein
VTAAPDPKQQLEQLAEEARQSAAQASAQLERLKSGHVSPEVARQYVQSRRARLWRMPAWLWVPAVVLLVVLCALALFAAGR